MRSLRSFIIFLLVLCVPTAGLASVVNAGHCQRNQPASATSAQHAMHAGMSMPGDHSHHMAHMGMQKETGKGSCTCGCNCSGTHCVTSCSALMAGSDLREAFSLDRELRLAYSGPTHPVAAHHLDLIRPPSLI